MEAFEGTKLRARITPIGLGDIPPVELSGCLGKNGATGGGIAILVCPDVVINPVAELALRIGSESVKVRESARELCPMGAVRRAQAKPTTVLVPA